jgi:hypothetical protein
MNPKQFFHWTARILATAVSLIVLGVALSRSTNSPELPPLSSQSTAEMVILSLILISTIGLLIGWHHELFGGLLAAICGTVLIVTGSVSNDIRPIWVLGAAFAIPGLLYLSSALWPENEPGDSSHSRIGQHPHSQQ